MSKQVLSAQDKISAVMKYREGNISQRKLAEQSNVSLATMQQWIRNYELMGKDAFLMKNYKNYSKELKLQAVQDYLDGQGSLNDICKKYGIRATSKLGKWIKQYNSHEELKASRTGGTVIMTKGRKTIFDERVEIASYCISHDHNYAEAAEKFSVLINRPEIILSNTKVRELMHYETIVANGNQKILLQKSKDLGLN